MTGEIEKHADSKDLKAFVYLLRFAKKFKRDFFLALALITFSSAAVVLSARLLGSLVDRAFTQGIARQAYELAGWILLVELLAICFLYYGRKVLIKASTKTVFEIRSHLFAKLARLPMSFFDREAQGRIVTRMTYDVEGLESFFTGTLTRMLSAILSLVIIIVAMLWTELWLGTLLIGSIVPAVLFTYMTRAPIRRWNSEFARRNSTVNARLNEYLNGLPVIRSFGAENWSKQHFDQVVDHHLESALKINWLNSWLRPLVLALCQLPLILLLLFGGRSVIAGALSIGLFVAFVRYCERFTRPINALANELHMIQQAFTNADRVARFLSVEEEDSVFKKVHKPKTWSPFRGELRFENVSMSYDGKKDALKDVTFHVPAGTQLGVIGHTGSGKSSTAALIARLYPYHSGKIFLDGRELAQIDRQWLRSRLGFVSQDVVIFKATVRENLEMGQKLPHSRVMRACERSGLATVLERSGRTMDSPLLNQGLNLSAGERALMALTRVLIKDPDFLILDEATANVDPELEELLQKGIAEIMKNRSSLAIAHRLATLRRCTQILHFQDGRIVGDQIPQSWFEASKGLHPT